MERQIFGVGEINQLIKDILNNAPVLTDVCVRGEISNYKLYPSGHHYFTLKDAEGSIRCVMFRREASWLPFRPENGMKVIIFGRVSVFPRDGAYQLYCQRLSPDGVGELHVAFEQLKEKLWKEGLFAESHKKPLPPYPETIAIITSPAGAAVHDMMRILRYRYPLAKVKLLPVRVQGTEAPLEIAGAICYANRYRVADVIITGRGGGSIEDLWAFNDERVAHAIYESEIPIISAVGHEPDVTIADFVADVRAATPSHAAELAVPNQRELLARIASLQAQMLHAENGRLTLLRQRLKDLAKKRVLRDPMAVVEDKRLALDHLQKNLTYAAEATLLSPKQQLVQLSAKLDALSPLKVLGRGFAIVTNESGSIVKNATQAPPGTQLTIALSEGKLNCCVQECTFSPEERTYQTKEDFYGE